MTHPKTAAEGNIQNSPNMPAAFCVVAAGVGAALHIGKLPPALPVLEHALGITLVQAGFLLSLVQLAGMTLGLLTGLAVQRAGLKRSMIAGLLLLGSASALGALAPSAVCLLLTRAFEGLGFLWVVLPAPGLLRELVPPKRIHSMMGIWGAYMPLGTSLALLLGPWTMLMASPDTGWRWWWCLLSAVVVLLALVLAWRLPAGRLQRPGARAFADIGSPSPARNQALLGQTLRSRPVWLLALTFAMYSGQWMAVVGFLPSIYANAAIASTMAAWLTALAAALNIVGNVLAGRLLQRGIRPALLLYTGFVVMGMGAMLAFGVPANPWVKYAAVLAFSMLGGLIPGTLFSLALRLAPSAQTVSTTIGWMQQWSAAGQFAAPPLVAWVVVYAGGWQWTGWVTGALSVVGLLLTAQIHAELERRRHS